MNNEAKIAKEKDDILRMAKDRMTIYKSDSNPDRYRRVCSLASELKAQGYINLLDTTGSISLWLTYAGEVFLENGGFCGKGNEEKRKKKWSNILLYIIAPIIVGIILWLLNSYSR